MDDFRLFMMNSKFWAQHNRPIHTLQKLCPLTVIFNSLINGKPHGFITVAFVEIYI